MPFVSPKFFSIVLLGRQNPQILNHDFLIKNRVLPIRKEPFRSLIRNSSEEKQPFSEFLSTPPVTTLTYKWISIIIEINRYQIRDNNFKVPSNSPIVNITKQYFGKFLTYTPFQLGGMNFAFKLGFSDDKDEKDFDDRLGIDREKFGTCLKTEKARFSTRINSPWNDGQIEIQINKPKKGLKDGEINFNFEFFYENIDSFIGKLDEADKAYKLFNDILKKLKVGRKK